MNEFQSRFLIGVASGTGSIVVKVLLNILLIPAFIKTLGLEYYGLYVLLLGLNDFFQTMDFGFSGALVKYLTEFSAQKQTQKIRETLKFGHLFYLAISVSGLILACSLIPVLTNVFHVPQVLLSVAKMGMLLIFIEAAITLYGLYARSVLWSHSLHQWNNLSETFFNLSSNLGGFVILWQGKGLLAMLMLRVVCAALRTLYLFAQARRVEPNLFVMKQAIQPDTSQQIFRLTWHSLWIKISVMVSHKIDVFVIAAFLPLSMVGIYEIVMRFLGIVTQIAEKLAEGILPVYNRSMFEESRRFFIRISSFLNVISCLMLLIIAWYFSFLVGWFGAGRISYEQTLPVLYASIPFIWSGVVQHPATYYLFSNNREAYLATSSLITAFANLALSIILVQVLGIIGVALGTLVPQMAQHQLGLIVQTRKELRISLMDYIQGVYAQSLLPLAACFVVLFTCTKLLTSLNLLNVAIVSAIGFSLGAVIWLITNTTSEERSSAMEMFSTRLFKAGVSS